MNTGPKPFVKTPWATDAACRGLDPNLFFPPRGEPLNDVLAVCAACPVRDECLHHALTHHERLGVWGGTSERQRRLMKRRRRRKEHAA